MVSKVIGAFQVIVGDRFANPILLDLFTQIRGVFGDLPEIGLESKRMMGGKAQIGSWEGS